MRIRSTILQEIREIASEQGKTVAPLRDELILLDSGLDSLCFAILLARLEDKLGLDLFGASDNYYLPVTLLDLIKYYEEAAKAQCLGGDVEHPDAEMTLTPAKKG